MKKNAFLRWLVLTFGLAVVAVLAGGLSFYRNERQHAWRVVESELQTITRVKVDQLAQWRAERLADASMIMDSIYLREGVAAYMDTQSPAEMEDLLNSLRSTAKRHHHRDILLVDANGQVLLSVTGHGGRLHVEAVQALSVALRERRAVLSDLHSGPGDLPIHLGVIAPIFAVGTGPSEPLGAVILQCDTEQYLYPLIQSWPVPSASGETVFFRRDGNDVLFLSPLRFQEDAALNLRIPLTRTDVPAVMAVQGKTGIIEGTDYRGVEVLSFLRPVPDSPWFLVVKQDTAEIFAPLRQTAWATATVVALLILTLAFAAGFVWRQRAAAQEIRLLNENLEQRVRDRTAELRESENAYRAVCANIPGMVYSAKSDWSIQFACNTESFCGTQADALVSGSIGWQDIVHPDDLEDLRQTAEALTAGPLSLTQEYRIVGMDGTVRWVSDHKSSRFNARGEYDGVDGIVLDATVRKHAEEALSESESRYRLLMQHATDVIWVIDPESQTCLYISPSVERMLGYTDKEMIGRSVAEVVTPASLEHIKTTTPVRIEKMMRGDAGTFTDEIEVIHKAGHTVLTEMNMQFVLNPETNRVEGTGVMRDITERKRAEAELAETHQVLEGILSVIPVRVFWKDRNLVYLGCNRAFASDAGLADPKDIIGKDDFQMGWRDRAELYRSDDRSVIASGSPRLLIEEPQTTPTGDTIWLLTSKVPFRGSDDEILGVVGTYMDTTERKRAEAERLDLARQLQEKQKLAAVGTLACGMGHEVNNPIMGIMNYAQLIKDGLQGKDNELEEFAGEIIVETQRVAAIVRSLSAFASRDTTSRAPAAVSDLFESALAPLREELTHDQIALDIDLPDNLPALVCDRGQMAQVLTSLLNNARDALNERYPGHDENKIVRVSATEMSGVGCRVSDVQTSCTDSRSGDERHVWSENLAADTPSATRDTRHAIRLTVEDHGPGIPPEVQEHIFEPFFTTKDRSVGAGSVGKGLGLFVSYAVVQEHGGALSVESEPGNWTRFHINLPTVPADEPQAKQ